MARHYIACDLGAESGRVMLGTLDSGRLAIEEMHRFATGGTALAGTFRWDILRIYAEIKEGLRKVAATGVTPASVSVDSWGVDYAWRGAGEPLLATPFHYRDSRNDRSFETVCAKVGPEKIFAETGVQFMPINTLYQLADDVLHRPKLLSVADGFLHIADFLNYLLGGAPKVEASLASTSQLYNPVTRAWSLPLAEAIGLDPRLLPEIVPAGTVLGDLADDVRAESGLGPLKVVASCSHDTGAAVAAVPAQGDRWAYLSSGTWSLMGLELPAPLLSEEVRQANFTNEVGFGGSIRFLKNISGFWLLQECRREWARAGSDIPYDALVAMTASAEPLRSLIDPNRPEFAKPGSMPQKIEAACRATGEPVPENFGGFVRCILESLALIYRDTLESLRRLSGRPIDRLHIGGGGSRNAIVSQATADAANVEVVAGPIEGTAIGNALVQAIALGDLPSLDALRATVRDSFPVQTFKPNPSPAWDAAFARFQRLRQA
jgi:rhamnulokinase